VSLLVPFEGPATVECRAFIEAPTGAIRRNQTWETREPGRPTTLCKCLGTELATGTTCVKLQGLQQSKDWHRPRPDGVACRRRDVVWVSPNLGVAYKVERTLERREPAHREPSQRSVAQFELQPIIQYPGQLFEDRKREILQARSFAEAAAPLLPNPSR